MNETPDTTKPVKSKRPIDGATGSGVDIPVTVTSISGSPGISIGPVTAQATPRTDAKSIAVKSLCFFQPHPAFDARNSIASESAENRSRVLIEFIPSLRHHRVERRRVGEPARVTMVPESLVASWEPLG